jgi:hypothetical protein
LLNTFYITETFYICNKEIVRINADLTVDGFLNGCIGDLKQLLSCKDMVVETQPLEYHCNPLKTLMKQAISVLEKGIKFAKNKKKKQYGVLLLVAIEVDGKMSLEVFSESAGCDIF